MVCLWDDKIPTMFLEFMNLLTLAMSEEQLRASVKDFAEKNELDKYFHYGFGSHHFYQECFEGFLNQLSLQKPGNPLKSKQIFMV